MVCRHEISANIGAWMCHIWCRDAHDCGERRLIPLLDGDPDLDRHLAAGVVLAQMDFCKTRPTVALQADIFPDPGNHSTVSS
jgi:hypothetical protein